MYRIFIVEDDPGIARGIKKQMEFYVPYIYRRR